LRSLKETGLKKIHLTTEDMADFFAELYILKQAEIPEKEALEMMAEGQDKKNIQRLLTALNTAPSLRLGLAQLPAIIPEYIIALLGQEETKNNNAKVLKYIAKHLYDLSETENIASYRQQLRSCFLYPAILLLIMFMITTLLQIFVMPVLADLFASFGAELPQLTIIIIKLMESLESNIGILLILSIILAIYLKSSYSSKFKSLLALRLPIIGSTVRNIESSAVINTLYLLCSYQFDFTEALRLSASATHNTVFITALTESSDKKITNEYTLDNLRKKHIFSEKTMRLLEIFEKTQQLDILENIAQSYRQQIPKQIALSLRILNIILLIVCWLILTITIIGLYLPIFKMGNGVF
jgi:type IV pilus assembly protein PilC